jgi:hypothetical protein
MAADPEPSLYQKFLTILDNALNKLASIASAIKNYVVQTTSRLLTFSHTRPAAELGTRSAPTV